MLTCWNYSRYFFTLLLRCMGVTCGTRTFSLSLRGSDGSGGGGGEFTSMIRSRRLGGLSSSGLAVFGFTVASFLRIDLLCFRSFSDPLCSRFPLSATLVLFGVCKKPLPETPVRGLERRLRRVSHKSNVWRPHEGD